MRHWLIREKSTGLWWGKTGPRVGHGVREDAIVFHCAVRPELPAFDSVKEEWVEVVGIFSADDSSSVVLDVSGRITVTEAKGRV